MAVCRKVALERTAQHARERWPEMRVPTTQNREFPRASHSSLLPTVQVVLGGDCPEYW